MARGLGLWFCGNPLLQKFFLMNPAGGSGWARVPWRRRGGGRRRRVLGGCERAQASRM